MAKPTGKAGKRALATGRDRPRARKSGVRKASKSGSRKPKSVKSAARKQKAAPASESARLKRQLREALERQTATSEVLEVISSSAGDLQPVFRSMLNNALRICEAKFGHLLLFDGRGFLAAELHDTPAEYAELFKRGPLVPAPNTALGRLITSKKVIHIPDVMSGELYTEREPLRIATVEILRARTLLAVPMLRDSELVGAIVIYRQETRPFSDRQIELVTNFAAQAVIAIENARLFNETKEALAHQTATSEVLKAIGSSMADTQPVFERILDSVERLFEIRQCSVILARDQMLHMVAARGVNIEGTERLFPAPMAETQGREVITTARQTYVPSSAQGSSLMRRVAEVMGDYSVVMTPLIWEGQGIGMISAARAPNALFSDKELALLRTFADQAVIAIENARLFNETQEALERQTATSNVLQVISQSMAETAPVFESILDSCEKLIQFNSAGIALVDGEQLQLQAARGPGTRILWSLFPQPLDSIFGEAIRGRKPIYTANVAESATATDAVRLAARKVKGYSLLQVPMLWQDRSVGSISIARLPNVGFSDKEVSLLKTFAAQAVIAIENTRLFEEVQARTEDLSESLQQQTATADVLKVISRSAFDLDAVMNTLARSAAELCDVSLCGLHIREGDFLVCRGYTAISKEQEEFVRKVRIPVADTNYVMNRVLLSGEVANIGDFDNDRTVATRAFQQMLGFKAILMVPLMREGHGIGLFVLGRDRVGEFSQRHIDLVQTFADQAVIAIENVRLFDEVQAKTRDLTESLQQQTATADVLKIISRSAFDLQTVLDTLTSSAVDLLGLPSGTIVVRDGDVFRYRTRAGAYWTEELWRYLQEHPITPGRNTSSGRAIQSGRIEQIPDIFDDPEFTIPMKSLTAGHSPRAILAVPLIGKEGVEGALSLSRQEPGLFAQREIDILQTFADQAVIAIENTRLFNETQEALEQQKASADILSVISNSVSETQPVFDEILRSIARLFGSQENYIFLVGDDNLLHVGAGAGWRVDQARALFPAPLEGTVSEVAIRERRLVRSANVLDDPDLPASARERYRSLGENYAMALAPMLWEDRAIGSIMVARASMEPFSDKECKLLSTFADQAVIAIQNARLFNETKEALERQTATSDILNVIAGSPTDTRPVFEAIASRAKSLVGGFSSTVFRFIDGQAHLEAFTPTTPEADDVLRSTFPQPVAVFAPFRMAQSGEVTQIPDIEAQPDEPLKQVARARGYRSMLFAPLMNKGVSIGFIGVTRVQAGRFDEHHVQLLRTFADQAVIAIGNVQLFEEVQAKTRELEVALQQQTATADVLKVISRSAFDLDTVLTTLAESARAQCRATGGYIVLREGDELRFHVIAGEMSDEFAAMLRAARLRVRPDTLTGRPVATGEVVHIADVPNDTTLRWGPERQLGEFGSGLSVPLILDGERLGAFVIGHRETNAYTADMIELVKTFADQAIIAIKNARLFEQVQARTRELSKSLDDLRTAQDRLVQTEKLASLGQLTAGIAHEIKNPLNFVNNFAALSAELTDELDQTLAPAPLDQKTRGDVGELTQLLKSNLEKVVQHGKRADSIVKNMLLHSREGGGERRSSDLNALVSESLNLAYHGARAERSDFNITLEQHLDPDAGAAEVYPQELTRALLNLISNGFYAAVRRKMDGGGAAFEPVLSAATRNAGEAVEIRIRDNGTGIPAEIREKIFNPFFTTKPTGEGTGLGLSMTHDIIVKQHGGTIDVETEPGVFTEFRITLPRGNGAAAGPK